MHFQEVLAGLYSHSQPIVIRLCRQRPKLRLGGVWGAGSFGDALFSFGYSFFQFKKELTPVLFPGRDQSAQVVGW